MPVCQWYTGVVIKFSIDSTQLLAEPKLLVRVLIAVRTLRFVAVTEEVVLLPSACITHCAFNN